MATTHSYDSEQRLVDIPFRRSGVCKLNAHMPANPNLVPPGYYMVFVVEPARRALRGKLDRRAAGGAACRAGSEAW